MISHLISIRVHINNQRCAIVLLTVSVNNNSMNFSFRKNTIRNISLLLIALLAAVYCCSIDLSCDAPGAGGSIKGKGHISVTRSFIAPVTSSVRDNNGRNAESEQNIEKAATASDILSSITRKFIKTIGYIFFSGSVTHTGCYFLFICISVFAYLSLLTGIRFIHLKDGSK